MVRNIHPYIDFYLRINAEEGEIQDMNKFNIGEKYNEIGAEEPKEFIKWLLENLTANYKMMLRNSLSHILEMIAHYDHAQQAAEKRIHMPWDKEGSMVDMDYYPKLKKQYCESKLNGVFKALGMEDAGYRDPEIIEKVHVLEKYIDQVYDEVADRMQIKKDSRDYKKVLKEKEKSLDSIDFGKAGYGFNVNLNNEDVEIVIMPQSNLEVLAGICDLKKPYPFLLKDDGITVNGTSYCVIDAENKEYRECMVVEMLTSNETREAYINRIKETSQDKNGVKTESVKSNSEKEKTSEVKQSDAGQAKQAAEIMNMEQLFPASGQER